MQTFSKRVRDRDQAGAEAAGLRWLGEATDAVVNVVSADGLEIVTERVDEVMPTPEVARTFGAELARMHRGGAEAFGAPPTGGKARTSSAVSNRTASRRIIGASSMLNSECCPSRN